ncbi:alpha/beta hydrolase [Brevundimonas sp.]|uniref:alpha/beta hydrolase family protein n=2 Tax=unclassified Brevundimonas TaxID=2622653 RepID=UPI0028A9BF19|nr:alpha/beta hydrolase [Brevundimonas sp.]
MSLISSLRTLKRCSWPVRLAQTGVVLAAAGGLSACLTLDVPEDAFFWPDDRVAAEQLILPADPPPGDAEVVVLRYAAGGIGATRVRAGAANTPLILYCGGNTFRRSAGGGAAARKLSPLGDVLMFDYPGYGDTVGTADIAHFRAVTEVMARQARALADAESRPLIAWGWKPGETRCWHPGSAECWRKVFPREAWTSNASSFRTPVTPTWASRLISQAASQRPSPFAPPTRLPPVLVLQCDMDPKTPYASALAHARRLADVGVVRFVRIEGAPHFILLTAESCAVSEIAAFTASMSADESKYTP